MRIEEVVVQCVTQVRTLTLDYPHGPIAAGKVVRLACITGGHSGEHGSGCSCGEHYHGDGITISSGPPTNDNFPNMCGHGCVGLHDFEDVDVPCCGPTP